MVVNFCPTCGQGVSHGAQFCSKCGRGLAPAQPASQTATQQANFDQLGNVVAQVASAPPYATYPQPPVPAPRFDELGNVIAQVPPAPPQPMYPPAFAQKTNGLAVASLVLGLIPIGGVGAILAIVFGEMALKQIKESNGMQGGRGLAQAGRILGVAWVSLIGLIVLFAILGAGASSQP
jgi:hypothetical protein